MEIHIDINHDGISAALAIIATNAKQLDAVLDDIGNTVSESVRLGFASGSDPYGTPWEPLSPASRAGQPLRDTGRLMNSITHQVTGDSVTVGTNVVYALQHQFGFKVEAQKPTGGSARFGYTPKNSPYLRWFAGGRWHAAKGVTIPARPFLPSESRGLPATWEAEILDVISDYMIAGTA